MSGQFQASVTSTMGKEPSISIG